MKLIVPSLLLICYLTSCSNQANNETKITKDSTQMQSEMPATIDVALVDNKKDPACGMPVTAGIGDTTRYEGKLYGFCSKECKDEFLKNPKSLVAAAELKK